MTVGIGFLPFHFVPSEKVACVVGTIGYDDFVFVGGIGSEVASVGFESFTPREAGEAVIGSCTDDVLAGDEFGCAVSLVEFLPTGGGEVGSGEHVVHQVGHHDTVGFHTHATGTYIGTEEPRTVGRGLLSCLDILVCHIL